MTMTILGVIALAVAAFLAWRMLAAGGAPTPPPDEADGITRMSASLGTQDATPLGPAFGLAPPDLPEPAPTPVEDPSDKHLVRLDDEEVDHFSEEEAPPISYEDAPRVFHVDEDTVS